MEKTSWGNIETLLSSTEPEELRRGLELVRKEIARLGPDEARPLYEIVSTVFYIDPLDRPDLVPLLDEAVTLVAGLGKWVIPVLIQNLDAGDLKAQLVVAHALGRMGAHAIQPLLAEYETSCDPGRRAFVLYALGKIKSPSIVQAASCVLGAAQSPDRELRDTATRAIGKLAESIPQSELPDALRCGFVDQLRGNLADSNPGIRAKAVRSLGKLAKHRHLTAEEQKGLEATLNLILGEDEHFEWDRAYVVRKEAKEARQYL
jgi:HEAT repeat protein